ncbi:hypothetical protein C2U72_02455 [Prosthecomicrobium hirschii]|uniref:hypothetical protein n=1 Tax=Prosthecodimorpha hirschii TaxID=665126 RepID=UPI00112D6B20|nr:hypothetical protein [Prosthecomicrobium hirschii]TPQ52584.1 hypothetical protein C2U72_02455 [Prosthecomicrobium hirschii]
MGRSNTLLLLAALALAAPAAAGAAGTEGAADAGTPATAKARASQGGDLQGKPGSDVTGALPSAAKPKAATAKPKKSATGATAALTPIPAPVPFEPSRDLVNWFVERGNVGMPRGNRLVYCHGFECRLRTIIALSDADEKAIANIFASRRGSAAEERDAIDHLVQYWEKRAAPELGGPPDIRGSEPDQANQPGQTDCLDEATNSTTILIYAQQHGLLRYHTVVRPDSRGGFIYAHATAVYREIGGEEWVVDSWMRDSGDPNDIMLKSEWDSKH